MWKSLAAEILGVVPDPRESGGSLRQFEWQYRVLVLCADESGTIVSEQKRLFLNAPDQLNDRDLVLITLDGTTADVAFAPQGLRDIVDLDAEALRQDLDSAPGIFELVLVGKDGGVKYRSGAPVPPATIFETIDQMPMRKAEASH